MNHYPIFDLFQFSNGDNKGKWGISVDDEPQESPVFETKEEAEERLGEYKRGDFDPGQHAFMSNKRTKALWSRGETLDPDQF